MERALIVFRCMELLRAYFLGIKKLIPPRSLETMPQEPERTSWCSEVPMTPDIVHTWLSYESFHPLIVVAGQNTSKQVK